MITLGITGRSGCGKSTVTSIFAAHGFRKHHKKSSPKFLVGGYEEP